MTNIIELKPKPPEPPTVTFETKEVKPVSTTANCSCGGEYFPTSRSLTSKTASQHIRFENGVAYIRHTCSICKHETELDDRYPRFGWMPI